MNINKKRNQDKKIVEYFYPFFSFFRELIEFFEGKSETYLYFIKFGFGFFLFVSLSLISPVLAQLPRPDRASEQVYQILPNFPLENQYISQETGTIVSSNTLLSRLIRYHQYIKNRPLIYRLDWQLTFADYLQVNETMFENRYPGNQTLTINPLENDRKAIANLTRNQRNQLIDTLLAIYNPKSESLPPKPQSTEDRKNASPTPQRGSAELLLP